jgi:hypothetical protein
MAGPLAALATSPSTARLHLGSSSNAVELM